MLWTPMKNKFVLFFILLLVNFDIFSGKFKKVAKEKFNPLPVSSIIDDQPSDVVDGPALTLGCTMCQQIMNLTVSHYPNLATSIRRTILTEHCASLGLFSNICTKALNQYFTQIYNELKAEVEIRMKTSEVDTIEFDLRELCKKVGLCSGEKVPAFCKNYYVDDNTSPISMSINRDKRTKRSDL